MSLRSGYKGIKKLAAGLKWNRPGILAADDTALAKVFFPRSEQAVLGAVNIVPYPYSGSAGSAGGTTYTLDGPVIDVNCSNSSGVSSFSISGVNKSLLKSGITYYLSGAPATSASTENVRLYIILKDDNNNEQRVYCPQGGEIAFTVPYGYFLNAMGYYVAAGQTLDHVKVKPMIALSAGLSYVEPAMTNRQLTDAAKLRTVTPTVDGTIVKTYKGGLVAYNLLTRVCTFCMRLEVGAYGNYTNFVTGLPKAKNIYSFPCVCTNFSRNIGMAVLTTSADGGMYFTGLGQAANFADGDELNISGSYIIADDVVS